MFKKTSEIKVMRDVIHGYIHIDLQLIWDLVNTKEVQRLRRIHQLGGNFQVYHTAEHSRFSHSLGVYEIVRRMCEEIDDLHKALSEEDKVCVMIAALLHDVGHFPFSHAFESISKTSHEKMSVAIILGHSEIHEVLQQAGPNVAHNVVRILEYTYPNEVVNQMISGQLDADRMDYLLRDAYFTGTSYGAFDLERVLRTIRVKDNKLVVKESGIHSVEDYIMARYHMYWQVYYHPVCRSYEFLLQSIFKRLRFVYEKDANTLCDIEMLLPFLRQRFSIQDHFDLDENALMYAFSRLSKAKDMILKDLASRILNRQLLEYEEVKSKQKINEIYKHTQDKGYDPAYYCIVDTTSQSPYQPYEGKEGHNIWILDAEDKVEELSKKSVIVHSLVVGDIKKDTKVYFPK
ncbi:MAG: HD domain-containing protein [Breznakia sp.]